MKIGEGVSDEANDANLSKANLLVAVVRNRETTNQQLIKFYEKMYDDLKPKSVSQSNTTSRLTELTEWLKSQKREDYDNEAWKTLLEAVKVQIMRHY
ncbi:MAG: hypothetical protein GX057_06690 [Clostridiales bacterium]|jgi:hypothetical protein|nr:hypothetical protein [Clostridiales bacterium]